MNEVNPYEPPKPRQNQFKRRVPPKEPMFGIILTITFALVAFGVTFLLAGMWTAWID